MGKLKNAKAMEGPKTMSRGTSANVSVDKNEESTGTISKKHFGHVSQVASALHKGDPGFGQHKR